MKKMIERLTDSSTWSASADLTAVNLPRDGLITEVKVRANITITLAATAYDDVFRRVLESLTIEGDGKTFLGMRGGNQMTRVLGLWNEVQGLGPTVHSNGGGIALGAPDVGSTSFRSVFTFHPGSNPRDPFDLTAAIPARALSTLQAKLTTTANNVLDGGANITAGTFNYEISVVRDLPVFQGLMVPIGYTQTYAHTGNFAAFGYDVDVPAGAWLRSIVIMVQDDTATVARRKDDEVTSVKLKKPKGGDYVFEQNIYELKQNMMARFGIRAMSTDVGPMGAISDTRPGPGVAMAVVPAGFVVIDLRQYFNPLYGLDMRGLQTGDYKLGLTIENYAAGDDTYIYWDQLLPVDEMLVGR